MQSNLPWIGIREQVVDRLVDKDMLLVDHNKLLNCSVLLVYYSEAAIELNFYFVECKSSSLFNCILLI
jgi:hypothetical protein